MFVIFCRQPTSQVVEQYSVESRLRGSLGLVFCAQLQLILPRLACHYIVEISPVYLLKLNTLYLGASFCEFCLHVEDASYITGYWLE